MKTTSASSEAALLTDNAAIEARRLALIRIECAAGAAFGCDDDAAGPSAGLLTVPTAFAVAVPAAALAAAILYLF